MLKKGICNGEPSMSVAKHICVYDNKSLQDQSHTTPMKKVFSHVIFILGKQRSGES